MSDTAQVSHGSGDDRVFFEREDWLSFAVTFVLAQAGYLLTLSTNLDLGDSGVYAVGAMYPGVPTPPGYALWTVYGWLFIKLCPFSNIAWRLSLATSLTAAVACSLVALMVSRGGKLLLENVSGWNRLSAKDETRARWLCGAVAGLGFAFDGCVWYDSLRPDPGPLGLLLFALTLCLLMRWFFKSERRRYLWAAAFVYGLTLSNSQSLVAAAFGLPFLVAMGDRRVGREIFFGVAALCWSGLATYHFWGWFDKYFGPGMNHVYWGLSIIATMMGLALTADTRGFFSEWKTTAACAALLIAGLGPYLLSPLFAMTTPPMDWNYPRTVEGFFHLLTRGQFERFHFVDDFERFMRQCLWFGELAVRQLGWSYLAAVLASLFFASKVSPTARRWLGGLWGVGVFHTALLLVGLNPYIDYAPVWLSEYAAPHLLLTMLAGYGLILVAAFLVQPRQPKATTPPSLGEPPVGTS